MEHFGHGELTMWAWGYNEAGELGLNNKTYYSSPVQIPGTSWSTVSSGRKSGMATRTDGTLWMWGDNPSGLLGQGDTTDYSSPRQVPGTSWTDTISLGYNCCGAIRTDGTLWVWGNGGSGSLAQGPSNANTQYSSPKQIPGTTWSKIIMGGNRGAAIKTDGTLWTWGNGSRGILGQNAASDKDSPVQIPGTWGDVTHKNDSALGIKQI